MSGRCLNAKSRVKGSYLIPLPPFFEAEDDLPGKGVEPAAARSDGPTIPGTEHFHPKNRKLEKRRLFALSRSGGSPTSPRDDVEWVDLPDREEKKRAFHGFVEIRNDYRERTKQTLFIVADL